jgi:hypothetical protein
VGWWDRLGLIAIGLQLTDFLYWLERCNGLCQRSGCQASDTQTIRLQTVKRLRRRLTATLFTQFKSFLLQKNCKASGNLSGIKISQVRFTKLYLTNFSFEPTMKPNHEERGEDLCL